MRNSQLKWWGLCCCWAVVMTLMGILATTGTTHAGLLFLYVIGFVLMLLLVHFFPEHFNIHQSFTRILALASFGRLLFFALHLGSNPLYTDTSACSSSPLVMLSLVSSDLVLVGVVAMMMSQQKVPPKRLLLYAANPLVIVTVTGSISTNAFYLPVLFAALWLITTDRTVSGFTALGIAGVNSCLPVVVWPYFFCRRHWKPALLTLLVMAVAAACSGISSGPFHGLTITGVGLSPVDGLMGGARLIFGNLAAPLMLFFFCSCLASIYLVEPVPLRAVYLSMGALIIMLSPVAPRHMMLVAPFLCFFPSPAWIALQILISLWAPEILGQRHLYIPDWLKWSVPPLFLGLLALGQVRNQYPFSARTFSAADTLSVIVPTLNEAETIDRCLDALQDQAAVSQVIVADGGSVDDTRLIADRKGAKVIQAPRGRGVQVAAGIEAADADVVLILHSDCTLSTNAAGRILRHLSAHPEAPGGAMGMCFEAEQSKMKFISFINNMRAKYSGIFFGDQAQFVRCEALRLTGGYPPMVLMEDVELSMRLKTIGKALFLPGGVTVSGRRWQKAGFSSNILLILRLCLRYLVERRWREGEVAAGYYFRAYYDKQ